MTNLDIQIGDTVTVQLPDARPLVGVVTGFNSPNRPIIQYVHSGRYTSVFVWEIVEVSR